MDVSVESFLIEECQETVTDPEKLAEWKKIVDDLELEGQKSLVSEDKSPIPFPVMDVQHQRIYEVICPESKTVKEYDKDTIPLRVLSLVALSERECYFDQIKVHYHRTNPDPIVIGKKGDNLYMIARWGAELKSLVELKKIAFDEKVNEYKSTLAEKIRELQLKQEKPESLANDFFAGHWVYI